MCRMEGWDCLLYHGKMSADARNDTVREFAAKPKIRIMLCSLKCGGVGLNLTMASRVINIDPWYNNATEAQAFGRCYRIGQTRETSMLKLVVAGTIDQRMEAIKKRKQGTIDAVDHDKGMGRMTKKHFISLLTKEPGDGDGDRDVLSGGYAQTYAGAEVVDETAGEDDDGGSI